MHVIRYLIAFFDLRAVRPVSQTVIRRRKMLVGSKLREIRHLILVSIRLHHTLLFPQRLHRGALICVGCSVPYRHSVRLVVIRICVPLLTLVSCK